MRMAMTQRAITLNIQPIAAPCLRHSATGQPFTIFGQRPKVILRRVVYHRDGNFPGNSGGLQYHSGQSGPCRRKDVPYPDVADGAVLPNAAEHLHAVFRAPGRPARTIPANTNPATTLSSPDLAGDLSGEGGTSGALLYGDCLDVMTRSCFKAVLTLLPFIFATVRATACATGAAWRSDPDSKNPTGDGGGLMFNRGKSVRGIHRRNVSP